MRPSAWAANTRQFTSAEAAVPSSITCGGVTAALSACGSGREVGVNDDGAGVRIRADSGPRTTRARNGTAERAATPIHPIASADSPRTNGSACCRWAMRVARAGGPISESALDASRHSTMLVPRIASASAGTASAPSVPMAPSACAAPEAVRGSASRRARHRSPSAGRAIGPSLPSAHTACRRTYLSSCASIPTRVGSASGPIRPMAWAAPSRTFPSSSCRAATRAGSASRASHPRRPRSLAARSRSVGLWLRSAWISAGSGSSAVVMLGCRTLSRHGGAGTGRANFATRTRQP